MGFVDPGFYFLPFFLPFFLSFFLPFFLAIATSFNGLLSLNNVWLFSETPVLALLFE